MVLESRPPESSTADRHVGDELAFYRILQQISDGLGGGVQVIPVRLALQLPILLQVDPALVIDQAPARFYLLDVPEHALTRRPGGAHDEDLRQALFIQFRLYQRIGQQGLDLRPENKGASLDRIKQRLHSQAVAPQEQALLCLIPDSEGEDPVEALDALRPPFYVGDQQHLRIRIALERVTLGLQFLPQLAGIVQFAVIGQDAAPPAALPDHRLKAALGVDHDQSPVHQGSVVETHIPSASGPRFARVFCIASSVACSRVRSAFPVNPTSNSAHPNCHLLSWACHHQTSFYVNTKALCSLKLA